MGECIVVGRGGGQQTQTYWLTVSETMNTNGIFCRPTTSVRNNKFYITVVGGGGGARGGGSGNINMADVIISSGTVQVIIGAGATSNTAGGTTSFGSYISATGGESGPGGNGGAGGGGNGYGNRSRADGGRGGIYGGGGGGSGEYLLAYINSHVIYHGFMGNGGNGGIYGGGGGAGGQMYVRFPGAAYFDNNISNKRYGGKGGPYGGNGGDAPNMASENKLAKNGQNGTNTYGWSNVMFSGYGRGGVVDNKYMTFWTSRYGPSYNVQCYIGGGGGGGFGGNGGNCYVGNEIYHINTSAFDSLFPQCIGGAGGGGYGSNGGSIQNTVSGSLTGAGGGGYLHDGQPSDGQTPGGGGGWGVMGYGSGGGSRNANNGVCVISYQVALST